MPDVIVTHRLTKYYDGHCAVDSLNLRVAQGTVYGLLGRNGAGKTTAIKMLLGMAHPSYGRAEVLGEDSLAPAAGNPRPDRLSGRRPSALSLDDHSARRSSSPARSTHRWNQQLVGADSRSLRAFAQAADSPALARPAGASGVGAGRGHRSGSADPRRSHARARHGGPPRFPRIADPDHPAPRPHDPVQFAHPGRRGAGGRPHRDPGRRRVAGRLPDRPFQGVGPQGALGVRRPAARGCAGCPGW